MRVSVIVNSRAGNSDIRRTKADIEEALFRCDLKFCDPQDLTAMKAFIDEELSRSTDALMICGGDGTINVILQYLMQHPRAKTELPPVAIVRSGTANDLAFELGISSNVKKVARSLLDWKIKKIDLIELQSIEGQTSYMITNGGLGIPALTAEYANQVRSKVRKFAGNRGQFLSQCTKSAIKKLGTQIYPLMLLHALKTWDCEDWDLEFSLPEGKTFSTQASVILVNNQAVFGRNIVSAPFTSNQDGVVNLSITDAATLKDQLVTFTRMLQGRSDRLLTSKSYELKEFNIRSKNKNKLLTFFGDGEILIRDSREIRVRCLQKCFPLIVSGGG
jgi:diacylglycerol kinase family enzyme